MSYKIPLKEKRKLFCKKMSESSREFKYKDKNGLININCGECNYTSR